MDIDIARENLRLVRLGQSGIRFRVASNRAAATCWVFVTTSCRGYPTIRIFWTTATNPEGLETMEHDSLEACFAEFASSISDDRDSRPSMPEEAISEVSAVLRAGAPDSFRKSLTLVLRESRSR